MPRYFFDIRDQDGTTVDETGMDFRDLDAAKHEAHKALSEIAAERMVAEEDSATAVEIRDDTGHVVYSTVALNASVDRPSR